MILQKCLILLRTFYHMHPKIVPSTFIRTYSVVNNDDISSVSSKQLGNTDRQLKLLKLEIHQLRQNGRRAPNPETMTEAYWEDLLRLTTKSARLNYYAHLFYLEKNKQKSLMKKQAKKEAYLKLKERQALEEPQKDHHIVYSLAKTTFFLRIREDTMNKWRNNRLVRAMQFGEKLIFDCSYDEHMNPREAELAATQLTMSFGANRRHRDPFDVHLCNANFNCDTMKYLERNIPTVRNKAFPMNLHEESYLDLFPKEKLVYLTPHCTNDLVEYDPHSIYIIGAVVDKRNQLPLSLGKAKELGIRVARLPLKTHLKWCGGYGNSLTLDQMIRIMLDIKETGNWDYAFRHVPKRKLVNDVAPPRTDVSKWTDNVVSKSVTDVYPQKDNAMSIADKFKKNISANKVRKV